MHFKVFIRLFFGVVFIASPAPVHADTSNSTSIGISVIVPERAESQKCTIGVESHNNHKFIPLQHSGCQYDSHKLLKAAYQQAVNNKPMLNSQGFVTVVITAP